MRRKRRCDGAAMKSKHVDDVLNSKRRAVSKSERLLTLKGTCGDDGNTWRRTRGGGRHVAMIDTCDDTRMTHVARVDDSRDERFRPESSQAEVTRDEGAGIGSVLSRIVPWH